MGYSFYLALLLVFNLTYKKIFLPCSIIGIQLKLYIKLYTKR